MQTKPGFCGFFSAKLAGSSKEKSKNHKPSPPRWLEFTLNFRLEAITRRQILHSTSALVMARYHPSQCQILTLSTDGQVSYWEVVDGAEIRHITLGKHSTVTSLDVSPGDGENFITSTNDSLIKVILKGMLFRALQEVFDFLSFFSFGSTNRAAWSLMEKPEVAR